MKVKLEYATNPTALSKIQIVKAVFEGTSYNLKGAKEYVDENLQIIKDSINGATLGGILDLKFEDVENNKIIDLLKETYSVTPLSDEEAAAAQKIRKMLKRHSVTKPYKGVEEELGIRIFSHDEMAIIWQNKSLFNKKQAERVIAGLKDADLQVAEMPIVCPDEEEDSVMLTIEKRFPSGTDLTKLRNFSLHVHVFISVVCEIVNLEERLENARVNSIDAFEELRDYE